MLRFGLAKALTRLLRLEGANSGTAVAAATGCASAVVHGLGNNYIVHGTKRQILSPNP